MTDAPIKYAYAGEAMLVRWSENHNGRTVTLQLDPNIGDIHPFKGLRGGLNGQRMQLAAVLIGDDEQPLAPNNPTTEPDTLPQVRPSGVVGEGQETRRKREDIPRSAWAGMLTKKRDFQEWLGINTDDSKQAVEENANAELKTRLGIASKKELDTPGPKADAFDKLMTDFSVRAYAR